MRFAILGGDSRNVYMAAAMIEDGHMPTLYGFEKYGALPCPGLPLDAPIKADCVLLPFPAEDGHGGLNAPFSEKQLQACKLLENVPADVPAMGGKLSAALTAAANERGILLTDYSLREGLAIRNAIPSAEGAIEIAMRELPRTIYSLRCLVIGFGPGETRGRVEAQAADPADQVKVFGGDAGILSFLIKKLIGNELRVDPQPDDRMLPDKAGLLLRPHGPFLSRGSAGGRQGENRHAQI